MSKQALHILTSDWDNIEYGFASTNTDNQYSPEERLMFAIILQAVDDATSSKVPPFIRSQARTAIFDTTASPLWDYCAFLGIDFEYFRDSVAKMIKEGRSVGRTRLLGGV